MKIKKIIITVTISLVLFPLVCYVMVYAYGYSHRWEGLAGGNFEESFKMSITIYKDKPYALEVPLHEMDFGIYLHLFRIHSLDDPIQEKVILPCDVEYYTRKEDKEPALVLEEGTSVVYRRKVYPKDNCGYGVWCWPDYEKGWRYGYPFMTNVEEQSESSLEGLDMYYVKDSQLREVAMAYYDKNEEVQRGFQSSGEYGEYRTRRDFAQYTTCYLDMILYTDHAYLSEYMKDWK